MGGAAWVGSRKKACAMAGVGWVGGAGCVQRAQSVECAGRVGLVKCAARRQATSKKQPWELQREKVGNE